MDAITVMLKVVKFSHFLTRTYNKGMPGDEIRLASLFFDTASRTSKRKRNRRSEYPKALWDAVAEVKTFKRPCARLLPDIEKHVLTKEFPEQGTHSGVRLLLSSMARSVVSADALCHHQCPYGQ